MPRDANGNMTLVAGNPVVPDTAISADVFNRTIADLAAEIQGSLSRDGLGSMNVPIQFADGNVTDPSIAFTLETDTGFYRAAAGDLRAAILGSWRLAITDDALMTPEFTLNATGISKTSGVFNIDAAGGSSIRLRTGGAVGFGVYPTYLDAVSQNIKNVANPSVAQDAATKSYVDSLLTATTDTFGVSASSNWQVISGSTTKIGRTVMTNVWIQSQNSSASWGSIGQMLAAYRPLRTCLVPGRLVTPGGDEFPALITITGTTGLVSCARYYDGTADAHYLDPGTSIAMLTNYAVAFDTVFFST